MASSKEQKRAWYLANRELCIARTREWRKNNVEHRRRQQREYYTKNSAVLLTQGKERYNKNKDKINSRRRGLYPSRADKISVQRQSVGYKFITYRANAVLRGIPFELSREQFAELWGSPCKYCGEKIDTIGIDRVDNLMGYVSGNVVACCRWCNIAKNNHSERLFIEKCGSVAMHTIDWPLYIPYA